MKLPVVNRPISITVISWLFIATSGLALISYPLDSVMPPLGENFPGIRINPISILTGIVSALISLTSGISMLKRQNWGRWLYVVSEPIIALVSFLNSGSSMPAAFQKISYFGFIASGLFYLTIIFFLFRPIASKYFKSQAQATTEPTIEQPAQEVTVSTQQNQIGIGRRIAAIIVLGISVIIIGGMSVAILLLLSSGNVHEALNVMLYVVFIGGGFFILGLALWDWGRWRGVLGIIFCVLGGYVFIVNTGISLVIPEIFRMSGEPPPDFGSLPITGSIFSLVIVGLGVLLLLSQRRRDRALQSAQSSEIKRGVMYWD